MKDTPPFPFNFGSLVFTEPYLHTYHVTETSKDGNGITVDKTVYTVIINVKYDSEGNLIYEQLTGNDEGDSDIEFNNTYTSHGKLELTAQKTLEGRELKADEFSFVMTETNRKKSEPLKTRRTEPLLCR